MHISHSKHWKLNNQFYASCARKKKNESKHYFQIHKIMIPNLLLDIFCNTLHIVMCTTFWCWLQNGAHAQAQRHARVYTTQEQLQRGTSVTRPHLSCKSAFALISYYHRRYHTREIDVKPDKTNNFLLAVTIITKKVLIQFSLNGLLYGTLEVA